MIGKSKMRNAKRKMRNCKGFSLLELVIAMFILIILLSVAIPTFQYTIQHAKETVLKENIRQMENAIDQYGADKGKLPQSLQELIEARYLREIPVDPITEKAEWEEVQGEDGFSGEGGQGLKEIKSLADGEDSSGKPYKEY